ncbi:MAG: hypothetical protein HAW67_06900 [Endozoicomonadaceae bacterium]|nr:hypothetical protein [Endozoicomonadaceae bacterium]
MSNENTGIEQSSNVVIEEVEIDLNELENLDLNDNDVPKVDNTSSATNAASDMKSAVDEEDKKQTSEKKEKTINVKPEIDNKKGFSSKQKKLIGVTLLIGIAFITSPIWLNGSSTPDDSIGDASFEESVIPRENTSDEASNTTLIKNKEQVQTQQELLNVESHSSIAEKDFKEVLARVSELERAQNNNTEAFFKIAERLKTLTEQKSKIQTSLTTLKNNLNEIVDTGDNQFINQAQKINKMNDQLGAEIAKVEKQVKKIKSDEAARNAKLSRDIHELISVIPGKAFIRNTKTGAEDSVEHGDRLKGYGVIKKIAISGCITLADGEKYQPINGQCI